MNNNNAVINKYEIEIYFIIIVTKTVQRLGIEIQNYNIIKCYNTYVPNNAVSGSICFR